MLMGHATSGKYVGIEFTHYNNANFFMLKIKRKTDLMLRIHVSAGVGLVRLIELS